MKVLLLAILTLIALSAFLFTPAKQNLASADPIYTAFMAWQHNYGRFYESSSYTNYRFGIFRQNYLWILEQNSVQSEVEYGENQFMDMTHEEFRSTMLGYNGPSPIVEELDETPLVGDVDWRDKGVVTPVKDQGQCGSCWAFSTTGSMEAAWVQAGNSLTSLSESQLVDCSSAYGNMGCNGGLMDSAFKYIQANGLTTEAAYPYVPQTRKCQTFTPTVKTISKFTDISVGSATALQTAVTQQPVSIAVDANNWSFYRSGIFSNCGTSLDHGVLAVGYTSDYWIVKNSWASSWGESGYIRLKMGNTCGCANAASYPTI